MDSPARPTVDLGRGLSCLLVACTIELDNAFEQRWLARPGRPWLVSWPMWANFLRYVPDDGMVPGELAEPVNLNGLRRWRYLADEGDRVELTKAGRHSRTLWTELGGEVEGRWRERLGPAVFDELCAALQPFGDPELPRYLPVVRNHLGMPTSPTLPRPPVAEPPDLPMLLAQPLLTWTLDYERDAPVSLPMAADVLRVLDRDGVRVADLPRLAGVSKEGLAGATGFLERKLLAVVVPNPAARGKLVRLTDRGENLQHQHAARLAGVEELWRSRYGPAAVDRLGSAVAAVLDRPQALADAISPPVECWRARAPYLAQTRRLLADPVAALPHQPMVLHRGGFPDGA